MLNRECSEGTRLVALVSVSVITQKQLFRLRSLALEALFTLVSMQHSVDIDFRVNSAQMTVYCTQQALLLYIDAAAMVREQAEHAKQAYANPRNATSEWPLAKLSALSLLHRIITKLNHQHQFWHPFNNALQNLALNNAQISTFLTNARALLFDGSKANLNLNEAQKLVETKWQLLLDVMPLFMFDSSGQPFAKLTSQCSPNWSLVYELMRATNADKQNDYTQVILLRVLDFSHVWTSINEEALTLSLRFLFQPHQLCYVDAFDFYFYLEYNWFKFPDEQCLPASTERRPQPHWEIFFRIYRKQLGGLKNLNFENIKDTLLLHYEKLFPCHDAPFAVQLGWKGLHQLLLLVAFAADFLPCARLEARLSDFFAVFLRSPSADERQHCFSALLLLCKFYQRSHVAMEFPLRIVQTLKQPKATQADVDFIVQMIRGSRLSNHEEDLCFHFLDTQHRVRVLLAIYQELTRDVLVLPQSPAGESAPPASQSEIVLDDSSPMRMPTSLPDDWLQASTYLSMCLKYFPALLFAVQTAFNDPTLLSPLRELTHYFVLWLSRDEWIRECRKLSFDSSLTKRFACCFLLSVLLQVDPPLAESHRGDVFSLWFVSLAEEFPVEFLTRALNANPHAVSCKAWRGVFVLPFDAKRTAKNFLHNCLMLEGESALHYDFVFTTALSVHRPYSRTGAAMRSLWFFNELITMLKATFFHSLYNGNLSNFLNVLVELISFYVNKQAQAPKDSHISIPEEYLQHFARLFLTFTQCEDHFDHLREPAFALFLLLSMNSAIWEWISNFEETILFRRKEAFAKLLSPLLLHQWSLPFQCDRKLIFDGLNYWLFNTTNGRHLISDFSILLNPLMFATVSPQLNPPILVYVTFITFLHRCSKFNQSPFKIARTRQAFLDFTALLLYAPFDRRKSTEILHSHANEDPNLQHKISDGNFLLPSPTEELILRHSALLEMLPHFDGAKELVEQVRQVVRDNPPALVPAAQSSCSVCKDSPATHAFIPCGHKCVCEDCGHEWTKNNRTCIMCRSAVERMVKIHE